MRVADDCLSNPQRLGRPAVFLANFFVQGGVLGCLGEDGGKESESWGLETEESDCLFYRL